MPPNPPLSYFISIAIPEPNVRINIPKSLVKTMQRGNHKCNDTDNADHSKKKKKKWAQPRRLLPKKVGSIMQNVFGNKKSQEICSSNCSGNDRQCIPESKRQIMKEVESSAKNLNGSPDSKVSKPQKEILEVENEKSSQQPIMGDKQPLKVSLSLPCFFNKKAFMNSCSIRGDSSGNGTVGTSTYRVIGKKESSTNFSRVPSRRQKIRRTKSTRKKVTKQVEEESEQEESEELCKKRILMGERCRPLNLSGTLQYDKNGILLPEVIPCEEL